MLQKRDLPTAITQELVRIAIAPVLLHAAAEAKVLDPRAAMVEEEIAEGTGLRDAGERPACDVGGLLQRRSQVWGSQADHVANTLRPAFWPSASP